MARASDTYVCQSCGAVYGKWAGRCEACGEWNTISLEASEGGPPGSLAAKGASGKGKALELSSLKGGGEFEPRLLTGNAEFDRACGGGLVPGSALLIGGDPGVGKSTLLLQIAAGVARGGHKVAYISGEEATAQIRLRAKRLDLSDAAVGLAAATALRDILATLKAERPDVVIIDSIQTLWSDALPAAPGTVTQVRACVQELIRLAKSTGAAHEIGVFEMSGEGLREVSNPSELFLTQGGEPVSGAAVFAGIEGTRPVLVEIQALVSPSSLAAPRRAVVGWDSARLSMLLAVLDARCGLDFGRHDVFLNVAGGLRIAEPAADLAAAAALLSSLFDAPILADRVVFGEVALSGSVRPVNQTDARLAEARKLGFAGALAPAGAKDAALSLTHAETLADLVGWVRSAR